MSVNISAVLELDICILFMIIQNTAGMNCLKITSRGLHLSVIYVNHHQNRVQIYLRWILARQCKKSRENTYEALHTRGFRCGGIIVRACEYLNFPRGVVGHLVDALCYGQARSRVRFQLVSLEFFFDIILPMTLWPWGRLSLEQKWVSGIFRVDKGGRCVGMSTLPPSCTDRLEICEPQPSGTLRTCPGLMGLLYLNVGWKPVTCRLPQTPKDEDQDFLPWCSQWEILISTLVKGPLCPVKWHIHGLLSWGLSILGGFVNRLG